MTKYQQQSLTQSKMHLKMFKNILSNEVIEKTKYHNWQHCNSTSLQIQKVTFMTLSYHLRVNKTRYVFVLRVSSLKYRRLVFRLLMQSLIVSSLIVSSLIVSVFFHNGQEMMINEVNTMTTDLRSRGQKKVGKKCIGV